MNLQNPNSPKGGLKGSESIYGHHRYGKLLIKQQLLHLKKHIAFEVPTVPMRKGELFPSAIYYTRRGSASSQTHTWKLLILLNCQLAPYRSSLCSRMQ
jgi:hypothetical protein